MSGVGDHRPHRGMTCAQPPGVIKGALRAAAARKHGLAMAEIEDWRTVTTC